jgi:hypothetical protein
MPNVRKLTQEEVRTLENRGKGQRKIIEEEYDSFLADYGEGDYGEAYLEPNENRLTVRNRLKAAALRRGLGLDFKRTTGNLLRFKVVPPGAAESRAARGNGSVAAVAAGAPTRGRGRRKKGE